MDLLTLAIVANLSVLQQDQIGVIIQQQRAAAVTSIQTSRDHNIPKAPVPLQTQPPMATHGEKK